MKSGNFTCWITWACEASSDTAAFALQRTCSHLPSGSNLTLLLLQAFYSG